ncbi:MAG: hypothetical protein J0H39_21480 [Alphaproteobacteria bacterium]|nr:hypothetical protein [Alphaproteobacteria bacterium]
MKVFTLAAGLLGLSLAGCVEQGPQVRDTGGGVVGNAEQRDITPGESPLSVDGGGKLGAKYSQRRLQARTITTVEFQDGWIIHEVSGTNMMFGMANDRSTNAIDTMVAPRIAALGFTPNRSTVQRGRARLGEYAMIAAAGFNRNCWMFQLYPQSNLQFYDNGGFYSAYLAGLQCGPVGGSAADAEASAKRLLDALYIDNGALNRAQAGR